MTDWDGHVLRSHPTLSVTWGQETKVTVPHDLELSCDVTQWQCHQHFTWRLPSFMVQADDHELTLLPHTRQCNSHASS